MTTISRSGVVEGQRKYFFAALLTAVAAFAAGAFVPYSPAVAAAIAAVPILVLLSGLPLFIALSILIGLRALVDADSFGLPLTALLSVAIIGLGISSVFRDAALLVIAALICGALYVSNMAAQGAIDEAVRAEWVRTVSILIVVLIVANVKDFITEIMIVRAVQVIGFIPAVVAILQATTGTGRTVAGVLRPAGTLAHPNASAVLFSMLAVVSLALWLSRGRQKIDAGLFVLFIGGVLVSGSLGGISGLVAMLVVYAAVRRGSSLSARATVGIFLLVSVTAFVASPLGSQRLSELSSIDLSGQGSANNSLEWRLHTWRILGEYWERNPLTGIGYGATSTGKVVPGNLPHNEYLRLYTEVGIVGCLILVIGILSLLVYSWRLGRRNRHAILPAIVISVVVGLLINAIASNTFLYTVPVYVAALLCAGLVCVRDDAGLTVPDQAAVGGGRE